MQIKQAHGAHSGTLATLHRREIETGFLSKLGDRFLGLLYRSIIESATAVCLTATDQGELAGFVCGCENTKRFYKEFLRRHFFSAAIRVAPALVRPGAAKGIYESFRYSESPSTHPAELVSMVVGDQWRGSGLAADLLKELAIEFDRRGIADFKVVAGANLPAANAFYRKMGLRTAGKIEIHAGVSSNVYEAHISDLIRAANDTTVKKSDIQESK